jgi:hypothetical protein
MTPDAITLLFKEAYDSFPPIEEKPTDDNLLSIREVILPLLMVIPYSQLGGIHSLTAILTDPVSYATDHGGNEFRRPSRLPLYNAVIANDATAVVPVKVESVHKSRLDDFASYEAAERGVAKFLRKAVEEVWFNDLKDAETFYTKVTAWEIMSLLDANSGGLHAIDMIGLRTNMQLYYSQADGIPQFINMMEDAQKKAKRAGMPIADVELVMMALVAVLAAQHFPREVDDWEGLPTHTRTWTAWKMAFHLAHIKRQRQILASGGGQPLGGALAAIQVLPTINRLESALDNLALAATNNLAILQHFIAANLALTTAVTTLTAANKKLADAAANKGGRPPPAGTTPRTSAAGGRVTQKPFPGNYCWTHGHRVSQNHTSGTCGTKAPGHQDAATAANTMGGSEKDKGWEART